MRQILVLAAFVLASCSTVQLKSDDELLIAETVLRSLYAETASAGPSNKVGVTLCINGKDPPAEFIRRFSNLQPAPFPCTASQYNPQLDGLVRHGTTERMISFRVSEIKIISKTSAAATGVYYEASLSSAGYSFKLTKVAGKWVVQKMSMGWVS